MMKLRKTWTPDEDAFIRSNYKNKTYKEIGEILGRSDKSIKKRAIRLGINKKAEQIKFSPQEIQQLKRIYNECGPYKRKEEILKSFPDRTYAAVVQKAVRLGITPDSSRVHHFNENYFKVIDNNRKAYFYGLWCADGHLVKNSVGFTLQEEDSYLLEAFQEEIGSDYKIRQRTTKTNIICELNIHSKVMTEQIKNLGGRERKSLTIKFPKIDKRYYGSFIRGLYDGDGTIGTTRQGYLRFSIIGSKEMIKTIHKIFCDKFDFPYKNNYYVRDRNAICEYTGQRAEKIIQWIYTFTQEEEDLVMKRKMKKYTSFVSTRAPGALGSTGK